MEYFTIMTKRLIKLQYQKPSDVEWWDTFIAKSNNDELQKSFEFFTDTLHPKNKFPYMQMLLMPIDSTNSNKRDQYWHIPSLPEPVPSFLMDWYNTETRRIITKYIADAEGVNKETYNQSIFWIQNYKRDNDIEITSFEVVENCDVLD